MVDSKTKVVSYVTSRMPSLQEQYPKTYSVLTTPTRTSGSIRTETSRLSIRERAERIKNIIGGNVVFDIPSGVKESGATSEYLALGYASYLGMPTRRYEQSLSSKLQSSYIYMSKYQTYGYGGEQLGWGELKSREPALYLKESKEGLIEPSYDFLRWKSERQRAYREAGAGTSIAYGFGQEAQKFLNLFDVGFWKTTIEGTGGEYVAQKEYYDVMDIQRGKSWDVWKRVQRPAWENVILPMVVGAGIGAGIGAFKATSIGSKALLSIGSKTLTTGGLVEAGVFGYSSFEIGKSAISDPLGTGISLAISSPSAILGYKTGATIGYGRTEAYLYAKHTFEFGSPEYIRFREAGKIIRRLEPVKTKPVRALDISRDISRMTPQAAERTISFLKQSRRTTIGGSAAQYTQVYDARVPRDIDLFVRGSVSEAKGYFGRELLTTRFGEHRIDIHGVEFWKPGKYYRFGSVMKQPSKGYVMPERLIVSTRESSVMFNEPMKASFVSLREQLFRKGYGATTVETSYRWFKDLPDFLKISKHIIGETKTSISPITRWRGVSAAKHLEIFKYPGKSKLFGKTETIIGKGVKRLVKPGVQPETVYRPTGEIDYIYPSYVYPKSYMGYGIGYISSGYPVSRYKPTKGYISSKGYPSPSLIPVSQYTPPTKSSDYTPPMSPPDYTPSISPPSYSPPISPPDYTPPVIPPYIPPYKPPDIPPYKPPTSPPLFLPSSKKREILSKKKIKEYYPGARKRKHPVKLLFEELFGG